MARKVKEDLTGKKFGLLTFVREAAPDGDNQRWWAKCDCGTFSPVYSYPVIIGRFKSCGCKREEYKKIAIARNRRQSIGERNFWAGLEQKRIKRDK